MPLQRRPKEAPDAPPLDLPPVRQAAHLAGSTDRMRPLDLPPPVLSHEAPTARWEERKTVVLPGEQADAADVQGPHHGVYNAPSGVTSIDDLIASGELSQEDLPEEYREDTQRAKTVHQSEQDTIRETVPPDLEDLD